ncbi:Hvo_1808 family surface protein [Natronomonas sp.]|uniref:Hvo_1808 family surface protein n=1 Tax=Natronomonas sp. TaxID=2184060 RepID=UPI00261FF35B|nr:Hvo_1808 family surface protein [Natronomonas sp.]
MTRRPTAALAFAAVLVLAGCTVGYGPADAPERSAPSGGDPLGYYDGYWHNDTFAIDAEDGLSAAETEAVVSRAMARVQLLRGLRFESDVEVEVVSRETFREEIDGVWSPPGPDRRALDNAQHEALFLVGPDEDAADARRANRGGVVLGFYQPAEDRIVVVSGSDPATLNGETTLAHELLHALQDQRFGLASDASTLDSINARNGLIEGDATVVERAYRRNCRRGEWQCFGAETGGSALPSEFHWGVYFLGFFPYAEGPGFVEYHRDRGGWAAIDRAYDDVPSSSAAIIAPGTYGTDAYGEATLDDRSGPGWERVTVEGGADAATVGQAGLASMFAYTAYAGDSPGVIGREQFRADARGRYTYDVEYTTGWYGDRLHAYERDGETAYVWNVTFNDRANATAFAEGYAEVAAHWNGERRVRGDATVWAFDRTDRFRGVVRIEREDNAVTVIKAPTEAALGDVYGPAAVSDASGVAAASDPADASG